MKAKNIFGFIGGKVRRLDAITPEVDDEHCTNGGPHVWATYVSVHKCVWDINYCLECTVCGKKTAHHFQMLNTTPEAKVDPHVCRQCSDCGMTIDHAWWTPEEGWAASDGRGTVVKRLPDGLCVICQGKCPHNEGWIGQYPYRVVYKGTNRLPEYENAAHDWNFHYQEHEKPQLYDPHQFHSCPICGYGERHWRDSRSYCRVCGKTNVPYMG